MWRDKALPFTVSHTSTRLYALCALDTHPEILTAGENFYMYQFRSGGSGEHGDGIKCIEYVNINKIMEKRSVKLQEKINF